MKNLNIVLGLDQSANHSGYSIFDDGKLIKTGSILSSDKRGSCRLFHIKIELDYVLNDWLPAICVMEGYSFGSLGRARSVLWELGGVIKLLMYERDVPLYTVAPTALKKYICGSGCGFAPKEMVICEIYDQYDLQFEDDNEADAFVLGLIGHQINMRLQTGKFSSILPQHQYEVLTQILSTQGEVC